MSKQSIFFFMISTCYFLSLISSPNQYGWDNEKNYIDFDVSMQTGKYPQCINKTRWAVGVEGIRLLNFFRNLYNKNNLTKVVPQKKPKIPKIIHFIALEENGSLECNPYIDSVKRLHPDWEYKIWTNKEVAKIALTNQEIYNKAKDITEKADILKYEILFRYGGICLETNVEGLKKLDSLHHCYDFFIGIAPLYHGFLHVETAIIGSAPGHPVLKHVINNLPKNFYAYKTRASKTGSIAMTASFFLAANKFGTTNIAFPSTYFYPIGTKEADEKNINPEKRKNSGAFCIYWWNRQPIQQTYNEFKKMTPHFTFHGAQRTLNKITEIITKQEEGIYLRFGDGEAFIASGQERLPTYQKWTKNLEKELRESIALNGKNVIKSLPLHNKKLGTKEPGMFIGNHELDLHFCNLLLKKVKPFWGEIKDVYSAIALHYAATYKPETCIQFLKRLKKNNCIFVGNKDVPLEILQTLFGERCQHIPSSATHSYKEIDQIEEQCAKELSKNTEYTIVITAMGAAGKALQKRLWKKFDTIFLFDFGSLIDALCGWNTRHWIESINLDRKKFLKALV